MKTVSTDVAIIGAGTAGMTAYRAVKRAGKSALLIESGPFGTTCARVGCMPSKLLIAAADAAHGARHAAPFGIHVDNVRIDGPAVMRRVRKERDRFVGFVLADIEGFDDADKLSGHARFVSDNTLLVDEHTRVEAGSVVIASGTSPVVPDDLSHLGDRVIVNDDVFDWETLPASVLVVGTGVIGLELGQALSRLGVQTTLINRSASLGGLQDPDVRASAAEAFAAELDLRPNTVIKSAHRVGNRVQAELCSTQDGGKPCGTLIVDTILVAAGRTPNLKGLGLENTTVRLDERQRPISDSATLQLAPAPIFIAGDATGMLPVLHEAADEGTIAGTNAAKWPDISAARRRAPLAIVFSDPQLAYVGKRYSDLPETGVVKGEVSFVNQGRSRIILKNQGMLHVYAQHDGGLFLGAEMAGPHMEHIAHLLSWAVQQQLTVFQMLDMPFYHPVIEEGVRTALRDAARQCQRS